MSKMTATRLAIEEPADDLGARPWAVRDARGCLRLVAPSDGPLDCDGDWGPMGDNLLVRALVKRLADG
ncbi:MAG: hypothetical protein R3F55_20820 [Alphaproteobacteria bacterium]